MEVRVKEFLEDDEVKCIIVCEKSNIEMSVLREILVYEKDNATNFCDHYHGLKSEYIALCYNAKEQCDSILQFASKSKLLIFKKETESLKQLYLEYEKSYAIKE
jgi:hypothetical protein